MSDAGRLAGVETGRLRLHSTPRERKSESKNDERVRRDKGSVYIDCNSTEDLTVVARVFQKNRGFGSADSDITLAG